MSTTWGIRHRPESPQRPGRHRGPSDTSAIHPGELFKPVGLWTRARVARDSWSTLRALRPMHEWPRRDGRACGPSEAGRSCPGELVNIRALRHGPSGLGRGVKIMRLRTRAQVTRDSWSIPWDFGHRPESPKTAGRHRGTSDPSVSIQDSWSTPRALGPGHESPGTACRPRRPTLKGPCLPGELVDIAGPQTRVRVTQDSWSTPRDLGHDHNSPGGSG